MIPFGQKDTISCPNGFCVTEIEYAPTEHQGQMESNKEFRYDFMCKDEEGSFFIVNYNRHMVRQQSSAE